MDHARVILAIVLSFLVFLVWDYFFSPKRQPVQQAQKEQTTNKPAPAPKPVEPTISPKVPDASQMPEPLVKEKKDARRIVVETPLYIARFSEYGAVIESLVLKEYRESVEKNSPLKELINDAPDAGVFTLTTLNNTIKGLSGAIFNSADQPDEINVVEGKKEIRFTWKSPEGIVIERVFRFNPQSYLIGHDITVHNGTDVSLDDRLVIGLSYNFEKSQTRYGFEGPSAFLDNSLEQIKIKDIKDKESFEGQIDWVALQDRYFMSALVPEPADEAGMRLSQSNEHKVNLGYVAPDLKLEPGAQQTFTFDLYNGPKSWTLLRSYNNKLDKSVNFGMFDFLAKPCLWLMNSIYAGIPNYGVAIIILTLITKILLWPLGTKSYKSMQQMKRLQPLIQEIREKYKDDKKKINEETMALYRTYKINPLGGCLPMLVQIPVFFALYRMLYEAIELRHAPFMLWINDLSAPDRLMHFDFSIPFMQPPYGIPVLTIVMGATMLLQQKMQPPMGDPTQAKIMMLMPLIFTFIFINFSSGLVLYWLVNNIVSIAQQHYTNKRNA
jgi:YidC/Oxa1 family membrane protein insertase